MRELPRRLHITSGLSAIGGSLTFASPLGAVPGDAGVMVRSKLAGAFGGLGARLTGDKFANGFVTGAFAHMWNAEGMRRYLIGLAFQAPLI